MCLNFLLFCRSCLGGLVPRETRGRPLFTPRPMGTLHLMMRPLWLVTGQLKFYKAISAVRVMIPGSLARSLWRPDLGGDVQLRRPAFPLSPVLFPVGLPHGVGRLYGEGPLEERREPRLSSLT